MNGLNVYYDCDNLKGSVYDGQTITNCLNNYCTSTSVCTSSFCNQILSSQTSTSLTTLTTLTTIPSKSTTGN